MLPFAETFSVLELQKRIPKASEWNPNWNFLSSPSCSYLCLSHLLRAWFVFVYMCVILISLFAFSHGHFHLHLPPSFPPFLSFGSQLGFFLPWIPHSLVIQAQSLAPCPPTEIMNEKPCCSLQITQPSSVSQIQMEVTARQSACMMDSPPSKPSRLAGSF